MKIPSNPLSVTRRLMLQRNVSPSGCWLYTGRIGAQGYGVLSINNRETETAHRLAYWLFVGDIPEGLQVLHSCDVRACFNPDHLWAGSQLENVRDMIAKGREPTHWGRYTLTSAQVDQIKALKGSGLSQRTVAGMFGCGAQNIGKIWNGRRWQDHSMARQAQSNQGL